MDLLVTTPDGVYVDCTVGGGGHSLLILEKLSSHGQLIACDRDADAIRYARHKLPSFVQFFQISFSQIRSQLRHVVGDGVAGVLMDLGVSSYQIDTAERGFSHQQSGPLDLRMNPSSGESAAELLSRLNAGELKAVIREYGEDPQAARIARAIVRHREREAIQTTQQLAQIIDESVPATRIKSRARVFQALRIAVNRELDELQEGLSGAWDLLKPSGRLAVISYHSLEDRIVKNFMKEKTQPGFDKRLPLSLSPLPTGKSVTRKPEIPDTVEIERNPRARSAKLRVIEKLFAN